MNTPLQFYTTEKETLLTKQKKIKQQLFNNSLLRFLVFLSTAFAVYYTFYTPKIALIFGFLGAVIFVFLIIRHGKIQYKKEITNAKIKINNTEIDVLNKNFNHLETGKEFTNPEHFFSNDIDLFGTGSFFQYINRTSTQNGKELLANTLTNNAISFIEEKQKMLQELATKIHWRQHFSAVASLVSIKTNATTISKWILQYMPKIPPFFKLFSIIFSTVSVVFIGLLFFKIISFSVLIAWFFLGLGITGFQFKNVQQLYTQANNAKKIFKQYYLLLEYIENESFSASFLQQKQAEITLKSKKASLIFKEFSKILDAFDQRNNIIIALVGNGLFLWDIKNAIKTENWIITHKNTVEKWFHIVHFFDAQNSLANFVYNHPEYVFPVIQQEKNVISSEELGHPLLNSTKRITNNFTINNEQFFIITGANMAGKSTFLRTVSLAIVMANNGLPVCATAFKYSPIKLITSMRTSDSLTNDESYFYSELKRLKFIVNQIKTDTYFIILDEILKGTNSKDKAVGSKKFVEKLNSSNAAGIIATHDISLCELANEFSTIKNYYFDAEIKNNELYFDYIMKNGICKNMNASFLLKKMEIV